MCRNTVQPDRPQLTLRRKPAVGWIPEATNTHTECVKFIAFLLEQWLNEGAAILRYTYIFFLILFLDLVLVLARSAKHKIKKNVVHFLVFV